MLLSLKPTSLLEMLGVRNRVPIKNYFPFFVRKGEEGGLLHPKSIHLFFVYKDCYVIGGFQESNDFGIISKEEDHGRLQVGEKKPQCDRRVVKSGKEDQRETTKSPCAHFVLVSEDIVIS